MLKHLISIVDDDERNRKSTIMLIESFGFQAAGFESAESFLKSTQLHDTSCLIIDLRMPVMNGLQLQGHLAAKGQKLPIIVISAYDDRESRRGALQAGTVAFITKPFNDELLLHAVHGALGGQLGERQSLISLIDDDESIRRTTTLLVDTFGFRAAAFESAEAFLRSGRLHETSCLIVDVQLPGMNGLQLQRRLAAEGYKVPIIFITAYDNSESRQQAMQAGAIAFLGKPFNDELLLETIRTALRDGERNMKRA